MIRPILGKRLGIDWRIALLTVISTLLVLADYYYSPTGYNHLDSLFLYILIPLSVTTFIFRDKPANYGFSFGNWKVGVPLTAAGILLMAPVIWYLGKHQVSMQAYYRYAEAGLIWKKGLEMAGWEYLFRGWLLFGYAKKYGPDALWLQAVPFAVAHLGKPALETMSTIFGGFAFGWLAWRTGSFFYPFLLHWFIGTFIILVASGAF